MSESSVYARVAGRVGSLAQGFQSGFKAFDDPGPKIEVSPFGPGQVSAPAGILKALTAVAADRRARANYQQEQTYKRAGLYRQALETKALEQRVNAPTFTFDGVGGLSGPEYLLAKDRAEDNARALAPRPGDYVQPSEADVSAFGLHPDEQGRVPTDVYNAQRGGFAVRSAAAHRAAVEKRVGEGSRYGMAFARARLSQLDAEKKQAGYVEWMKVEPQVRQMAETFTNPNATMAQRETAAKFFELPYYEDPTTGAKGWDTGKLGPAIARAQESARIRGEQGAWATQAAERASYAQMFSQGSGAGYNPEVGDFEQGVLDRLDQAGSGTGVH